MGTSSGTLGTVGIIMTPSHHARPRDSRSHTVCRREHPPWVDEGASAEMHPDVEFKSQAHLPGSLTLRRLRSSHDAYLLLGWAWRKTRSSLGALPCPSWIGAVPVVLQTPPFLWPVKVRERDGEG